MPPSPFAQNLFLRTGNRCGSFISKIVRGNHRWDHAWSFNKTEDTVVFLRSIWGICVTSLLYSGLFLFFFYIEREKNSNHGLRKQRWKFSNCSFVFFLLFFFFFRCLEYELHWNGWKIRVNHRCTILLSESDQWKNHLLVLQLLLVKLYNCFSLISIFRHELQHIYINNYML